MKNFFNYIDENISAIALVILLLLLMIFGFIFSQQLSRTDIFDLEERCYNFYQENNYILDECYKYENKLKGMKD